MSVFQDRPYERHMVTNISTLLAAGNTIDALAVGQLGIFDAKTNRSVTAPTYAVNKTIFIAQGTPDRSNFPEGAGVPNIYRKTHPIAGKKIKSLRARKANPGQGEIVALGFDGVDTSKTLSAKPGETFYYWVRLTGDPIFNLNPDQSKGVIIEGAVQMPCADDCADNCSTVDCQIIVNSIVNDFNTKILPGGSPVTKYAQMTSQVSCEADPSLTILQYDTYTLNIPDAGGEYAVGVVQAQYPGLLISRSDRTGILSTYTFNQYHGASAPADFSQSAGTIIPNCSTCPVGSTSNPALTEFQVSYDGNNTGIAAIIDTALTAYDPTVVTILQQDPLTGVTTYNVTVALGTTQAQVNTALAALRASTLPGYLATILVGNTQPSCTLPATTYAWTRSQNTCYRAQVQFTITLQDDVCGNNHLTALQAAYASVAVDSGAVSGTVAITTAGTCANVYTLTTFSQNCVGEDCFAEQVVFPTIPDFNGSAWTKVPLATGTAPCVCGVELRGVFVPRVTREATFDQFAYQTDFVHIEISSHNPDWRSTDVCENDPIATRLQNGAYPNGAGQAVARLEKADRMYDMDYFYMSPVLREAFDFYFETKFDQYYDMVAIEYEFEYASNNGFGQYDHDRYIQYFWLPQTQAGQLITALNTYVVSASIDVEPIVL